MGLLVLVLDARTDMSPGAPVVASVLTEDLDPVTEVPVPVGGAAEVEVEGGSYLVRAVPPAGAALSARVSVEAGGVEEVRLGHVASPHEWLEWHALLGTLSRVPDSARPAVKRVWMRVWRREPDGSWTLEPVSLVPGWQDDEYATARVSGLEPAHRVLQVGGEEVPWRIIALPPGGEIEVLVQATPVGPALDAGVDVSVVSGETGAEMLLRYLSSGRLDSARVVGDELASGTDGDPIQALIVGYYLLQVGASPAESPSLAERLPGIPDARIIDGWRAMREGDVELGRRRLLEAASMGAPLYAEGLRLLGLGLRLLEARGDGETAPGVVGAIASVGELAAATNWTEPLTSYYGGDPASPSLAPPTGVPEGPLTWMGPEPPTPPPPPPPQPGPAWLPWALVGVLVVAAVVVGVWLATRGGGQLSADPSAVSFGEQAIESPGASQAVTLSNETGVGVTFRSPAIRGRAADDFAVTADTCSGVELADGASCSLVVVFTPSARGMREARLVIRRDDEGERITVPLDGVGVAGDEDEVGPPLIAVDPTSITFPADVPEEGLLEEVTISNDGESVLEVDARIEPGQEGFALDPESLEACEEVEAGGDCALSIASVPVLGGRGEATLILESNASDEPLRVPLTGTPRAVASPPQVTSEDWEELRTAVVVTNTGTRVMVPAFATEGERFAVAELDCGEVLIGEECSVVLAFNDDKASSGDYLGTLIVNDGTLTQEVPLTYNVPVD